MRDDYLARLQKDEAERPIRFVPTFRQLYEMFRRNWDKVRFSWEKTEEPHDFRINVHLLDKRLFRRAPDSTIGFLLREGRDEIIVSTNVDLAIFGEEISDEAVIRISRKEKTKVSFVLKQRGAIHLYRYEGREAFQVSL